MKSGERKNLSVLSISLCHSVIPGNSCMAVSSMAQTPFTEAHFVHRLPPQHLSSAPVMQPPILVPLSRDGR